MSDEIRERAPAVLAPASMIRLADVSITAGSPATRILNRVTLDIASGPPTLLIGPNGAGKTSLLRLIMGLADLTSGSLAIACLPDGHQPRLAIVFQKPVMLRRSAAANVAVALAAARHPSRDADIARLLEQVGLSSLSHRPARRLSGGEQQRLALARALARQPDILLLDEPTASLDPAQTKIVEDIVGRIAADGVKVVMATHDLGQARRLGGDIAFLAGGRLIEHAPAHRFFTHPQTTEARRFVAGDLVI